MYRKLIIWIGLWCCGSLTALAGGVRDSLAALYYNVIQHNDRYIVSQGATVALFDDKGRALTGFDYARIMPGLDGRFVATLPNRASLLIDADGNFLARFREEIKITDTLRRVYRPCYGFRCMVSDSTGQSLSVSYGEEATYKKGRVPWVEDHAYNNPRMGVKDTFGRLVLPAVYDKVSMGNGAYTATLKDTTWVYSMDDKLLFRCLAGDAQVFDNGLIGTQRLALWDIRDRSGRQLQPYKHWRLKSSNVARFIEGNAFIDEKGREITAEYDDVKELPGGLYYFYNSYRGPGEVRNAQLKPLPQLATDEDDARGIGARYLELDTAIYDLEQQRYTHLEVEKEFPYGLVILKDKRSGVQSVWAADRQLDIAPFNTVEEQRGFGRPYYQVSTAEERRGRSLEDLYSAHPLTYSLPAKPVLYGLLDSAMHTVLPMQYAAIRLLSERLAFVKDTSGRDAYVIDLFTGKRLHAFSVNATINHEQSLVRITDSNYTVLLHAQGKILYEGRQAVVPLYAFHNNYDKQDMPDLLLISDSTGNSGLFSTDGKQLLPYAYRQVEQKAPGILSLKKDDSVYFFNYKGRALFGRRGFSGRDYHILPGYAAVYPAGNGWLVIDAYGRKVADYDTIALLQDGQMLAGKQGRYALLDDIGSPRYPLQQGLPVYRAGNFVAMDDGGLYRIRKGSLQKAGNEDIIDLLQQERQRQYFNLYESDWSLRQAVPPGIYNDRGERLARLYSGARPYYNWDKVAVQDSLKQNIAVIDSAGTKPIPYFPTPRILVLNSGSIIALYDSSADRLYYRKGGKYVQKEIFVDTAQKNVLLDGRHSQFNGHMGLFFSDNKGNRGIAPARGDVLWDKDLEEVQFITSYVLVKKKGKWGLMDLELNYIQPPVCDEIQTESDYFLFRTAEGEGMYHTRERAYLPPVYDALFLPGNIGSGYVQVRKDGQWYFVDRYNQPLIPPCDSIYSRYGSIHNALVIREGKAFTVFINAAGEVELQPLGQRKRSKDGGYAPVVIYRQGSKLGLYNNEENRPLLAPAYDVINPSNWGYDYSGVEGYVAWRYKADKKDGVDSTVVVNTKGQVLFRKAGGHDPHYMGYGLWALNGHDGLPYADSAGRIVISDTFGRVERYGHKLFFQAGSGRDYRLLDLQGQLTTPLAFYEFSELYYDANLYLGEVMTNREDEDGNISEYYLVGKTGHVLSGPYDEVDLITDGNERPMYLRVMRHKKFGLLDGQGRELIPCRYDSMGTANAGRVIVKKKKWGIISVAGKTLVPFKYDSLQFVNGMAVYRKGDEEGYLDHKGKEVPYTRK